MATKGESIIRNTIHLSLLKGLVLMLLGVVGPGNRVFGQQVTVLPPLPQDAGGPFFDSVIVRFFNQTPGADIYYTLNGDTPTVNSSHFTAAFYIKETRTVMAIAVKNGVSSKVTKVQYVKEPKPSGMIVPNKLYRTGERTPPGEIFSLVGRHNLNPRREFVVFSANHSFALSL